MFHTYVACVLFGCLRMVAMVLKCFSCVFFQVLQKQVSSISTAFILMLQLLYLDISKVDQVLHLPSLTSATSSLPVMARHPYDAMAGSYRIVGVARPSPLVARAARAPCGARNGV